MRNYLIACIVFLFATGTTGNTQSVSYNVNSVPITGTTNSAFGSDVLTINTTGQNNSGFGHKTLRVNATGVENSAFGSLALSTSSIGTNNTAIGFNSLLINNTGNYNTGVGSSSLSLSYGNYNTGIGVNALMFNYSGNNNTAVGTISLMNNFGGNNNTALGYGADVSAASLTNATAIGYSAIVNNSNSIQLGNSSVSTIYAGTGTNATIISGGLQVTGGFPGVGKVLTSDAFGVATWQTPLGGGGGNWSLTGNAGTVDGTNFIGTTDNIPFNIRVNNKKAGRIDTRFLNTFYGLESGNSTTSGTNNTALGYNALFTNTTGSLNVAVGSTSLRQNTTGASNVAVGFEALTSNTTGSDNTAVGPSALTKNTTGIWNVAIGTSALGGNTTGGANVGIGTWALQNNTTGEANTATGHGSLYSLVSGEFNTGNGDFALFSNTTGQYNAAFGGRALVTLPSGSYNSALGYLADVNGLSHSNASAIGSGAIVNASNKIRLGDAAVTVIEGTVLYTVSDGRFKANISETDVKGLDFINLLRPVAYNFNSLDFQQFLTKNAPDSLKSEYLKGRNFEAASAIRQSGFIAQEVEIAARKAGYNFNGVHVPESENDNYSLAYGQFVVPLVKSVQELSSQNEKLKKSIEDQQVINQSLKNEISELKYLVEKIVGSDKTGTITISQENTTAMLFQNTPNPFTESTVIRYTIPSNARKAIITITSLNGVKIKEFDITGKQENKIEITGGKIPSGTYLYSLFVDGKLVDTKKMVLTQ